MLENAELKHRLARDARAWYTWYMTNNMTRRELRAEREVVAAGSHFANALAFIVESLADDDTPVSNTSDLENLDSGTLLEFEEMYNFTDDAYKKALDFFRQAVDAEVTNAFWDGNCRQCMENPHTFN